MNKSYHEIRKTSKLIDYLYRKAANGDMWIEVYQDEKNEYRALFSSDSTAQLPLTIVQHEL